MRDIVHGTTSSRRREAASAFTLIELLVVIGIIAILMSILVPVITRVRIAGYDSATTHRMQALITAIENYHQANGAYPGPAADTEVLAGPNFAQTLPSGTTGGGVMVTGTENLVLGLLGGLTYTWPALTSGGTPKLNTSYDPVTVGTGPMVANPLVPKRYGPFADPKACGLEVQPSSAGWVKWSDPAHQPAPQFASLYKDTPIPEFTDSFPDPLPMLYIRATGGNTVPVAIPFAPDSKGAQSPTAQSVWDPTQLQPYLFPAVTVGATSAATITNDAYGGSFDPQVQTDFLSPHFYFTTADHYTPRQRGGYLLIVAGKDRKFMTRDDRINGVPAQ